MKTRYFPYPLVAKGFSCAVLGSARPPPPPPPLLVLLSGLSWTARKACFSKVFFLGTSPLVGRRQLASGRSLVARVYFPGWNFDENIVFNPNCIVSTTANKTFAQETAKCSTCFKVRRILTFIGLHLVLCIWTHFILSKIDQLCLGQDELAQDETSARADKKMNFQRDAAYWS